MDDSQGDGSLRCLGLSLFEMLQDLEYFVEVALLKLKILLLPAVEFAMIFLKLPIFSAMYFEAVALH